MSLEMFIFFCSKTESSISPAKPRNWTVHMHTFSEWIKVIAQAYGVNIDRQAVLRMDILARVCDIFLWNHYKMWRSGSGSGQWIWFYKCVFLVTHDKEYITTQHLKIICHDLQFSNNPIIRLNMTAADFCLRFEIRVLKKGKVLPVLN
jgi:hypothetical protein